MGKATRRESGPWPVTLTPRQWRFVVDSLRLVAWVGVGYTDDGAPIGALPLTREERATARALSDAILQAGVRA